MWKRVCLLGILVVYICGCAGEKTSAPIPPDYLISAYGSGVQTANLPHTDLLDDPVNRLILSTCAGSADMSKLTKLPIDSLDRRLELMCDGHVLTREGSDFRPAFPFFAEAERVRLDSLADMLAERLVEPVTEMLDDMRSSDSFPEEEQFHVLWSLVIDQSWRAIWERVCPDKDGPPQVVWITDPPHPYLTGTNFWQLPGGSMVAATWSPRCDEHLEQLPQWRLELLRAAWNMPGNDSAGETFLRRYGFLDEDGRYEGFTHRDSAVFANMRTAWIEGYADAVAAYLDLKAAASALDVPENQTFVILLHEVAYALFQRLDQKQILGFPAILKTGAPADQIVHLVSVRLERPPMPKDVALAEYMENGWHGTDAVIPLFRDVLAADSSDLQIRLCLGMALYDLKRYEEAITEFENLASYTALDPANKQVFDWSRLWLGHVYDAFGRRDISLRWYEAVARDGAPESEMSFAQYGIKEISATAWASQRLTSPFIWPRY